MENELEIAQAVRPRLDPTVCVRVCAWVRMRMRARASCKKCTVLGYRSNRPIQRFATFVNTTTVCAMYRY
jgi:hypothetical protein